MRPLLSNSRVSNNEKFKPEGKLKIMAISKSEKPFTFTPVSEENPFNQPTVKPYDVGFCEVSLSYRGVKNSKTLVSIQGHRAFDDNSKPEYQLESADFYGTARKELSASDFEFLRDLNLDLRPTISFRGGKDNVIPLNVNSSKVQKTKKQSFDKEVFVITDDDKIIKRGLSPKSKKALKRTGALLVKVVTVATIAYLIVPAVGAAFHWVSLAFLGHPATHAFDPTAFSGVTDSVHSVLPSADVSDLVQQVPIAPDAVTYDFASIPVSASIPTAVTMAGSAVGGAAVSSATTAISAMATTAAKVSGWDMLIDKAVWLVNILLKGIIIFAGVSWMFGNRTKALEHLLCGGIGYVIVQHHADIARFFASL